MFALIHQSRAVWGIALYWAQLAVSVASAQDYRMFLETDPLLPIQSVPSDPDGVGPLSGVGFSQPVTGGQMLTIYLFIQKIGPGPTQTVRATHFTMPCSVPCSVAGSVDYVNGSVAMNTSHPLYVVSGLVNMPVLYDGPCPDQPPRVAAVALAGGNPVTTPRYGGEIQYAVSADCGGSATFVVPNEPDNIIRVIPNETLLECIPFSTDGLSLIAPTDRCCSSTGCQAGIPAGQCGDPGTFFQAGMDCTMPCCVSGMDCKIGVANQGACMHGSCGAGLCSYACVEFGDVNGSSGPVDLDDIFCALDGFMNLAACPHADVYPCEGSSHIDMDDILSVLDAFSGVDWCGCDPGGDVAAGCQ